MKLDQKTRGYIYRVAMAAMPILVIYGVVSPDEAAVWVGLVAALLSFGVPTLAAANTPVRDDDATEAGQ